MALLINDKFAPRANPGDTNYPNGSIKNESVPGAKDGTPLDADWGNDYAGADAALFAETGIVPNGNPDTILSSQRFNALTLLIQGKSQTPKTLAEAKSNSLARLGDNVIVVDRANGLFEYVDSSTVVVNSYNIIACEAVPSLALKLNIELCANVKHFGAAGDGSTNDVLPCQAALDSSVIVFFPPGTYNVDEALVMKYDHMKVFASASTGPGISGADGGVKIRAHNNGTGFKSTTVGGQTYKSLLWYQRPSGQWDDTNWIEGGLIEGITFDCINNTLGIDGIIINRVAVQHEFSHLTIENANIGIRGTKWGWGTSFTNLFITECLQSCVTVRNGYNGLSFTGCFFYGGSTETQRLLSIEQDSYGNTFSGGAIEGGVYGVYLDFAQLALVGVDFEVISTNYIYVTGKYNPGLTFAAPISSASTCTFVGVTQDHAIRVKGGMLDVSNSFFFATAPNPGSKWAFYGEDGADKQHNYATRPCISTSNNHFRNWGEWINIGNVFNRVDNLASQVTHVGQLTVETQIDGDVATTFNADRPYDTYLDGKARIEDSFGWGPSTNVGVDYTLWSARALGDVSRGGDIDDYVENHYEKTNAEFSLHSNNQGSNLTFGRAVMTAQRTNNGVVDVTQQVELNTIGYHFAPVVSNSTKLGDAGNLWSEVFAANGTINTSDDRLKTYLSITEKEELVAKELKLLIKKFKFNDAIELKGEDARIHFGTSAQSVKAAFESHGLDPFAYSLLCYDEWEEVIDEEGIVIREAGNAYGIRYSQLLCFIISAM